MKCLNLVIIQIKQRFNGNYEFTIFDSHILGQKGSIYAYSSATQNKFFNKLLFQIFSIIAEKKDLMLKGIWKSSWIIVVSLYKNKNKCHFYGTERNYSKFKNKTHTSLTDKFSGNVKFWIIGSIGSIESLRIDRWNKFWEEKLV